MVSSIVLAKQGLKVVSELRKRLDPNKRLAETTMDAVWDQLDYIYGQLEQRIAEVSASGCRPDEVVILAHQMIEATKRTADEEKRRRLADVFVNGLCMPDWDKVTHRMMLRFADELEEEHVARLARDVRTKEEILRDNEEAANNKPDWPGTDEYQALVRKRNAVQDAIEQELIARKLLDVPEPLSDEEKNRPINRVMSRRGPWISVLGRMFLEHVRGPEGKAIPPAPPKPLRLTRLSRRRSSRNR